MVIWTYFSEPLGLSSLLFGCTGVLGATVVRFMRQSSVARGTSVLFPCSSQFLIRLESCSRSSSPTAVACLWVVCGYDAYLTLCSCTWKIYTILRPLASDSSLFAYVVKFKKCGFSGR